VAFRKIDPGGTRGPDQPRRWCLCSQNDLEPVLLDGARERAATSASAPKLVGCEQDADGVTAVIRSRETARSGPYGPATWSPRTARAARSVNGSGSR